MSPLSLLRCVSVSVMECLLDQIDEVHMVSSMSNKSCVSVSVVELALGGSATNRATQSSFDCNTSGLQEVIYSECSLDLYS